MPCEWLALRVHSRAFRLRQVDCGLIPKTEKNVNQLVPEKLTQFIDSYMASSTGIPLDRWDREMERQKTSTISKTTVAILH